MTRQVDVAIVGAGSAGLYAMSQVKTAGKSFVLIDGGELGTTCARVGCMPSKALIQIAEDFHRRKLFQREGIEGGDNLSINTADAMEHVEDLRDTFVDRVLSHSVDQMGDELITANAQFVAPGILEADGEQIHAEKIILATGSSPIVPESWRALGDRIITTDEFFEMDDLPESMAIIGLGVIGLELGQSLHRLGVRTVGIDQVETIAGLTDPETAKTATDLFSKEMTLWLGQPADILALDNGQLQVSCGENKTTVDKVLVCMGRRPNLDSLQLDKAGIHCNDQGIPDYDPHTMQITGQSVFIAGDNNGDRPLLHEAGDEGTIAGLNACATSIRRFRRKTPFSITFSDPNIVSVGLNYAELDLDTTAIASMSLAPVGRALIMGRNRGLIRLYANKHDGILLGASLVMAHGEHLGHLLAWSIEQQMTVLQMLEMPFYHPVLEEALQPVLRTLLSECNIQTTIPAGLRLLEN